MNASDTIAPPAGEAYWIKRAGEKARLRSLYLANLPAIRERYRADRERLQADNRRAREDARRDAAKAGAAPSGDRIERLPDPRPRIERERADSMESVRLRLLWAIAAGGDEGTCAKCAVAVIRFAEGDGRHWSDRALKGLHIRLCLAAGLTEYRFKQARAALTRELFIPL